ncbi:MAG: hypothetical protein Q4D98_12325 [Planctomycetia bacterium]|nr:hypothetical protein [Planctomycetia bacterium]
MKRIAMISMFLSLGGWLWAAPPGIGNNPHPVVPRTSNPAPRQTSRPAPSPAPRPAPRPLPPARPWGPPPPPPVVYPVYVERPVYYPYYQPYYIETPQQTATESQTPTPASEEDTGLTVNARSVSQYEASLGRMATALETEDEVLDFLAAVEYFNSKNIKKDETLAQSVHGMDARAFVLRARTMAAASGESGKLQDLKRKLKTTLDP